MTSVSLSRVGVYKVSTMRGRLCVSKFRLFTQAGLHFIRARFFQRDPEKYVLMGPKKKS